MLIAPTRTQTGGTLPRDRSPRSRNPKDLRALIKGHSSCRRAKQTRPDMGVDLRRVTGFGAESGDGGYACECRASLTGMGRGRGAKTDGRVVTDEVLTTMVVFGIS